MLRIRLIVWVVLVMLGITGMMSASASAEPVWVVKSSVLKTSETSKANIKFGKLTITWEDKTTKNKFEAECKKASGEVELKGGVPGTDEFRAFKLKECVLLKGATECELTIGGVTAEELPGWATKLEENGTKIYDVTSGISFSLILEGCKEARLSKTWLFKGTLEAEVKNESGKIKSVLPAIAVEGDSLKVEGAEALLAGEGELEEKEGGTLEIGSEAPLGMEFYKCVKVAPGTGKFANGNCVTEGSPKEFELELLKELLKIVSKQTEAFALEGKLAGITVEIKCEEQKGTGSIHNGITEKDLEPGKGTKILTGLGLVTNEFKKCSVPKPAGQGCKITEPILVPSVVQLSSESGKIYTLFSPDPAKSSTVFVEVTLSGCTTMALNNTFPITGMYAGLVNNATSTLSFKNEEPNKKLLLGGNSTRFVGGSVVEMEGGGFINTH